MRRGIVLVLVAVGCSRPRHHREEPVSVNAIRDAGAQDAAPQTPAWVSEAVARGGPGLCASINEYVIVFRRAADGRLVQKLELSEKAHGDTVWHKEFRYDKAGRPIQKTVMHGDSVDRTVDLWYDKAGRVVRQRTHHADEKLWGGDINVTFKWQGKTLPAVIGHYSALGLTDPTDPILDALAFSGTVHEARFYDGSPAPQPERETVWTYDERGRLVRSQPTGYANASGEMTQEWDANDQLVARRGATFVEEYGWRDHRLVTTRYLDRAGAEQYRIELRYDASGRPIEEVRIDPAGKTKETVTSTTIDHDTLAITTVQEDVPPSRILHTYRYDCGPPATITE